MQSGSLGGILLFILCGICIFFSIIMLWALFKKGDERRSLILLRTSAGSFGAIVILLVLDTVLTACGVYHGLGSLVLLCGASVAFSILLAHYSKKYGG